MTSDWSDVIIIRKIQGIGTLMDGDSSANVNCNNYYVIWDFDNSKGMHININIKISYIFFTIHPINNSVLQEIVWIMHKHQVKKNLYKQNKKKHEKTILLILHHALWSNIANYCLFEKSSAHHSYTGFIIICIPSFINSS